MFLIYSLLSHPRRVRTSNLAFALFDNVTKSMNRLLSLSQNTRFSAIWKSCVRSASRSCKSKAEQAFPEKLGTAALQKLFSDGQLIQGRIFVLDPNMASINHPVDGTRIALYGSHRKHAFHGDLVLVRLFPIHYWKVLGTDRTKLLHDNLLSKTSDKEVSMDAEYERSDFTAVPFDDETGQINLLSVNPALDSVNVGDVDEPGILPELNTTTDEVSKRPTSSRLSSDAYSNMLSVKEFINLFSSSIIPLEYKDAVSLECFENLVLDKFPTKVLAPLPHPNLIRSGYVVRILKRNPECSRVLGRVAFYPNQRGRLTRKSQPLRTINSRENVACMFVPYSSRMDLIKLDPLSIPHDIWNEGSFDHYTTRVCQVLGWDQTSNMPYGILCDELGDLNDLENATKEILIESGFYEEPFLPEHYTGLPSKPEYFRIPEKEYRLRKDFRSRCIITIDPTNAKDFDDALHVRQLDSDLYEVGIHIADVSYFVHPGTALDREAAKRTTSVYLVQRVIPMLPSILSEHLCSLVPNADRLAFSILLTVNSSGEVINEWFGRSIVRSRARLTYDQAWSILKYAEQNSKETTDLITFDSLPKPEPPFTYKHLEDSLILLNKVAQNLRSARIKNGALTLDTIELQFDLPVFSESSEFVKESNNQTTESSSFSSKTIWPRGFSVKVRNPAHYLIEEWMILANQAVARRLFSNFITMLQPGSDKHNSQKFSEQWLGGLLRRHPQPNERKLTNLAKVAEAGNIHLDVSNPIKISESINKYSEGLVAQGYSEFDRLSLLTSLNYMIYMRLSIANYFSLDDLRKFLEARSNHYEKLIASIPSSSIELINLAYKPPFMLEDTASNNHSESIFDYTWHYGLSIPLYTHFTSPIRRYADLLVHRQLASIIGEATYHNINNDNHPPLPLPHKFIRRHPQPQVLNSLDSFVSQLSVHAAWCNERRLKARRAGEASQRLFLTACIKDCGSVIERGTVIDLNETFIKILFTAFGLVVEMKLERFLRRTASWDFQEIKNATTSSPTNKSWINRAIVLYWSPEDTKSTVQAEQQSQQIQIFSIIPCRIYCSRRHLFLLAELVSSDQQNGDSLTNNNNSVISYDITNGCTDCCDTEKKINAESYESTVKSVDNS